MKLKQKRQGQVDTYDNAMIMLLQLGITVKSLIKDTPNLKT